MKTMDYFKINVVTELEKESSFANAFACRKILRNKYGLNARECSEVYINVVKYQCRRYGTNLTGAFNIRKKQKRTDNIYKRVKRRP